jgi:CMP/dCMP kinase
MTPNSIAIDGPAASGKSTLAEKLAACLGYLYFDTGVMYRAVTFAALQEAGSTDDERAVEAIARACVIDVLSSSVQDGRKTDILLNGVDVTWEIRSAEVEEHVSRVSAYPGVRKAMTEQQRRIGLRGRVVMVGRDIGTVVLPEAEAKIYLDASAEERARRRYHELIERGCEADFNDILVGIKKRDHIDSTRSVAPLKAATDAIVINTDGLTEKEVLQKVLALFGGCLPCF